MSTPENSNTRRALAREWAAARIVVIGGLIVAAAIAGYFAYGEYQAEKQAAAPTVVTPKPIDAKAMARVELEICSAELIRSKDIGIVPRYADLATPRLARTDVARRFVCVAKTNVAKYFIGADLRCNKLADARCVSVFRIVLGDGRLLYVRPN